MFKSIRNILSAASDMVIIGTKEVGFQVNKVTDSTEAATAKLSAKAEKIRKDYEQNLSERKATINTEVVTESDVPKNIVKIN